MGDVFRFDADSGGPLSSLGYKCPGLRPWLGEIGAGPFPCGEHLRVLQRGASNVYFPYVVSSIYLPLWAEATAPDVVAALEDSKCWSVLSQRTVNGQIDSDACQMVGSLFGLDPIALQQAAQRKLEGRAPTTSAAATTEIAFRASEYQAITAGKVGPQAELHAELADLQVYDRGAMQFFSKVALVHKLRETRALVGFTRILPPDGSDLSPRQQSIKLDPKIDWLPAIKIYGEGLFLELSREELEAWANGTSVTGHLSALATSYNDARAERLQPYRQVDAPFVLLHTLAHLLINQLSFDCGYGSASLRERLYWNPAGNEGEMHGLLVYTASGDSEGTMGGLVRQGRPGRLEATIRKALNNAKWCSSDPVCIESQGQGSDNSNLAACHGCCLLPETSCEEGNRLLDRALLIGTPWNPELGFFQRLLI